MVPFQSDTSDVVAVSFKSNWRSSQDGYSNGDPVVFQTDMPSDFGAGAYTSDYLDALANYAPAVNTIRFDVNARSILDSNFQQILIDSADAGYQLILNYVDPLFGGRFPGDDRLDFNDHNVSVLDPSRSIELDVAVVGGGRVGTLPNENWGESSTEYDPLDYLKDGWGEILDWLDLNPAVKAAVYGYELINEPGGSYNYDNAEHQAWYANHMVELFEAHEGRWTRGPQGDGSPEEDARILVNIAGGGSGRVGTMDEVASGETRTALDIIRDGIGGELVWSVHFRGTEEKLIGETSYRELYKLAADDIIVTETAFDADFSRNSVSDLTSLYGGVVEQDLPSWAGWTLLDPIFNTQVGEYTNSREQVSITENGIGVAWWSPSQIDGVLFSSVRETPVEERDALAFALNMWTHTLVDDGNGSGGSNDTIQISEALVSISDGVNDNNASRMAFGYAGDDLIIGTDTADLEGLGRLNRTGGGTFAFGDRNTDSALDGVLQNFGGDKAYGGLGNDTIILLGGDDFGFGNSGDDLIEGGTGHDVLLGGDGDDTLRGGSDDDVLEGGDGSDLIEGGGGSDLISGGKGDDLLRGGSGADYFFFQIGDGSDTILDFDASEDRIFFRYDDAYQAQEIFIPLGAEAYAYAPNEVIYLTETAQLITDGIVSGTIGDDIIDVRFVDGDGDWITEEGQLIETGDGYNVVYDGAGNDTVVGGVTGQDHFFAGAGADHYDGITNHKSFLNYTTAAEGLVLNLSDTSLSSGIAQGDSYANLEWLHGTDYADTITTGNAAIRKLSAGNGDDIIIDGGGQAVWGGAGNDTYVFADHFAGDLTINDFTQGQDKLDVSGWGVTSMDDLTFLSESNRMFIDFDDGKDTDRIRINGGNWFDGNGDVVLTADDFIFSTAPPSSDGIISGTAGDDTIDAGYTDADGDVINDSGQRIETGDGFNVVYDGAGNDTVIGGMTGQDHFFAGAGADHYDGITNYKSFLYYTTATEGLVLDLSDTSQSSGIAQGDSYANLEWLRGSNYADTITTGNAAVRKLSAGDGDDIIIDGGGQAVWGGAGNDTFVFADHFAGDLTINDFSQGQDKLDVSGWGVTSMDDLTFTSGSNRMFIDFDDGTDTDRIRINGGNWFDGDGEVVLTADDFIFSTVIVPPLSGDGIISGTAGNDLIDASFTDADGDVINDSGQRIETGDGYNVVYDGAGDDTVVGGVTGQDHFFAGAGADHYDGITNHKSFLNYTTATSGLVIDLTDTSLSSGIAQGDSYANLQWLRGTDYADSITTGNAAVRKLSAGAGDDIIIDGGGQAVWGGAGNDTYVFADHFAGDLTINDFSQGQDKLDVSGWGVTSMDDLTFASGSNRLFIDFDDGADTDRIRINGGNWFDGNGDVVLTADDFIFSTVIVPPLSGDGIISGTAGNDLIDASFTDADGDVINDSGQRIETGDGYNVVYDGAGDDTVVGGVTGQDHFFAGAGADHYDGITNHKSFLNYATATSGLVIDLTDTSLSSGIAQGDSYANLQWLRGTDYADTITTGNAAVRKLSAGAGDDIIIDGGGQAVWGGAGNDTYVFADHFAGDLTINDFSQGQDKLDVSGWGVTSMDDLTFASGSNRLFIDFDDGKDTDRIRINGGNWFDGNGDVVLTADDFIFV